MSKASRESKLNAAREALRVSLPMEVFKAALPYLLALLFIALLGYWLIDPAPPKRMTIAVSMEDGNSMAYASLYAALLKEEGITLEIRNTEGPLQNMEALRQPTGAADLAFVPGGMARGQSTVGMVSLGSLYYEPLWLFHKGKQKIEHLSQLKGLRIGVGRPGSSTRLLSKMLLDAAGVNDGNATLYEIGEDDSKEALKHDVVDVIFLSGVPDSPLIHEVATLPEVALVDLDDAEALARQFTFLHHLVLPESALDLQANLPPRRAHLIAPTVTLVARESLHPALTYLLLKVLTRVHGGAGMLQQAHEFPADKDTDFELSSQAAYFYKSGPPFLDRYLPFWAATFVSRVLIVLLPLLALAIPLSRVAPAAYAWLVKSRIHKLYGELRFLELQVRTTPPPVDLARFRRELDGIENKVNHLRLPVAFSSHLYELRSHIALVRERLTDAP
ncbi:MAG: TAXI family TRAP transporter solute-binding subunit [Pseudomonadota bacterium]